MIPTRIHGYLDYLVGLVLIASPWLFGFADGGPEQWIPIILGVAALTYSLMTNYELGAVRVIPMPVHLMLDAGRINAGRCHKRLFKGAGSHDDG